MTKVLILEDYRQLAREWKVCLEQIGCEVETTGSVSAASQFLDDEIVDIFITDMFIRDAEGVLEREGGLTVLAHLLRKSQIEDGPVPKTIAITGSSMTPYFNFDPLNQAKMMQVTITLRKPVSCEQLQAAVKELLPAS